MLGHVRQIHGRGTDGVCSLGHGTQTAMTKDLGLCSSPLVSEHVEIMLGYVRTVHGRGTDGVYSLGHGALTTMTKSLGP
jgi:hypothetical protein